VDPERDLTLQSFRLTNTPERSRSGVFCFSLVDKITVKLLQMCIGPWKIRIRTIDPTVMLSCSMGVFARRRTLERLMIAEISS
jgi:hypothetical protein